MKGNMSIIHSRELKRNRTRERVQTRSRWSTEMNRERIEETIDERGKNNRNIKGSSPNEEGVQRKQKQEQGRWKIGIR